MLPRSKQKRANKLHAEAEAIMWEEPDAAVAKFEEAIELVPEKSESHYNLGLMYKYAGAWKKSLECNQRAVQFFPEDEAANWNLAIAATALREWSIARETWLRVGIKIPEGDGPIEANFGSTPVRLNPDGDGEVVWGRRICPVRVRVSNIPFPESDYRYGDIVLHDGAGTGEREWEGHTYPVFNVLELFERSEFVTHVVEIRGATDEGMSELAEIVAKVGACEDWSRSVRYLCKQCSEGAVHEDCDQELTGQQRRAATRRSCGFLP